MQARVPLIALPVAALCAGALVLGPGARNDGGAPPLAMRSVQPFARPLAFEPNRGRTDARVRYLAHGAGYSLFLTPREAVLSLGAAGGGRRSVLRSRLIGAAADPSIAAEHRMPGVVNALIGNDPAKWRSGIPTFGRVRYGSVYPGTDVVWYGRQGKLEYDFVLRPGADPAAIKVRLNGARSVRVARNGDLLLGTGSGQLRQQRPVAYQLRHGIRERVDVRYVLAGHRYGLQVGSYDRSRKLVIDPALHYSTYLGGTGSDEVDGIALDGSGNSYVAGFTQSSDFPLHNAYDSTIAGAAEAFVTKLSPDGAVVYSTYLGGSSYDTATAIAVDGSGNAYVTGDTASTNFPATVGAKQTTTGGSDDAFVIELNAAGSAPVYSTYLGGNDVDQGFGIAVDANGAAYVTGATQSSNFPMQGAIDSTLALVDTFVTKVSAGGSAWTYSTYLGGTAQEEGRAIAVDSSGNAYVAGNTYSTDFIPPGGIDSTKSDPGEDGFVLKVNAAGSALGYATYLGDTGIDEARGIAVSGSEAYVTGSTTSTNFPTANAYDSTRPPGNSGAGDAFVSKLNSAGSAFVYSTFLGGSNGASGRAIAVDSGGQAYVAGTTSSTDFPTQDPAQPQNAGGGGDVFVTKFNAAGSVLQYSSYLGGSGSDNAYGIAVDADHQIYVAGGTTSSNFPTHSAAQSTYGAGTGGDGFVAKIAPSPAVIDSGPSGPTTDNTPTFSFSSSDTGATFKCHLDNAAPATCTSPVNLGPLPDGNHIFNVQAYDVDGKTDGTIAASSFMVDTTAPVPALLGPADGFATQNGATAFTWEVTTDPQAGDGSSAGLDHYELWINGAKDGASFLPGGCSAGQCSRAATSVLPDGTHTWQIKAVDTLGNTGQSPVRHIVVDNVAPGAPALSAPSEGAEVQGRPELTWAAATDDRAGVAEYDVEIDGKALGLHLGASTLSFQPGAALTEGPHTWKVLVTDRAGNASASVLRGFRVDTTPPVAGLAAAPNPVLAGANVTLDASSSSDPSGGRIAHYEWDVDGDGSYERDGGGTATLAHSFATPGTYNVGVRVTDTVGLTATAATSVRVNASPLPPGQFGITINQGAQYTRSPAVTLFVNAPATATQMLVSNDGGFLVPQTFAPTAQLPWKLDSSGPERLPKIVYARFMFGPIVSETYIDDIILDEIPPTVAAASVSPAAAASRAAAAALKSWRVKLKATDSNSGVASVQITADKKKPGKLLAYKTSLKVKSAKRPKWVRARDKAGNVSKWRAAR